MEGTIKALIGRHGVEMTLVREGTEAIFPCFFQPVRSSSYQSMEPQAAPLGQLSQGQYTFLGMTEPLVQSGDILMLGEKRYLVRRVEIVCGNGVPLYQWGLCVERSEETAWGA